MDGGLRVLLSTVLCLSHSLLVSCSSQYPSFRSEPVSVVQSPGSVARLRCVANPPGATVSWRFRGRPLDAAAQPEVEVSGGVLVIPRLRPRHVGVYQCVARLDHGTAIASRYARVDIAEIAEYEETRRRSLVVAEGSSVVIECPLPQSEPPALPRLKVRGQRLEVVDSNDDYVVLPSGNLQIVSVSPQHQGMYKCGAYNPVTEETRVQVHGTKLIVKEGPSPVRIVYPTTPVTTVSMEQSRPLTLECVVSGSPGHPGHPGHPGNPAPRARWLKDGKDVRLGGSTHVQRHHDNLVFTALRTSHAGTYHCSVQAEGGPAPHGVSYTLNVLEPASIVHGLTNQQVAPGSSARFTCVSGGNPAPNVTWLLNADPVPPSPRLQVSGSSLVVTEVTSQDEGLYQCLSDNAIGSAQSSGMLVIQSEPHLGTSSGVLPDALPSLHPMQNDEGEGRFLSEEEAEGLGDAVAPPTATDQPAPEAPIITSPPQTHKPDVYDLEWRAGRDWGRPINAYFVKYRKVDEMGTVVGSWHTVRVPGSEKTLRLSELESSSLYEVLMVARSAAGEGQPAMLTFRTGKEKSVSPNKKPSKAPVVLVPAKAPEDKTANTHFGVVIHDRVPEAPDRPTISMATESSVYVTWIPRANGGSPITAFRVEYRRGRSAEWVVAADNISPLKLSVEVRNLEPGSTYRFRVVAVNTYGESPPSIPSKPYQVSPASPRFPGPPVAGPHISSTDAVSDTQIMLRWTYTPSSNNNTPIQGYYIYYRPTDSDNDSDYKKDVVDGVKNWHLIGHLQPETSYDIKMQCFNDGGESEFSNVMICETKVRQLPGVPSQHPVTPPGPYPPDPPSSPGGLLYLIVGCVLGVMVLTLLALIAICLWRNRQQDAMDKYDPPGYLYQPAEMNGHVLDYTTLPGSSRLNGGPHGGYGGPMLPQGCHHLHHKLPNGLALLNGGSAGHYPPGGPPPHGHNGSAPYEHQHPHHHHHNGGGMYTALPQTDSTDCMSCQNFCNNNRCYSKANGSLPLMHRLAPCQQEGLEMVPLGQTSSPCHPASPTTTTTTTTSSTGSSPGSEPDGLPPQRGRGGAHLGGQGEQPLLEEGDTDSASCSSSSSSPLSSQRSCCLVTGHQRCPGGNDTAEEEPQCVDSEGPVLCWESLGLPDLDCDEKTGWMSSHSLAGDLIQPPPGPQEV
ncbi:cell adhesion molecule-related/down-regulated by oncogenes [Aplochiton taeniatus]